MELAFLCTAFFVPSILWALGLLLWSWIRERTGARPGSAPMRSAARQAPPPIAEAADAA